MTNIPIIIFYVSDIKCPICKFLNITFPYSWQNTHTHTVKNNPGGIKQMSTRNGANKLSSIRIHDENVKNRR